MGYDPLIDHETIIREYGIAVAEEIYDEEIDALLLVTDHDAFRDIDLSRLQFTGKPILIDARAFFHDRNLTAEGFDYETL